MISNKPITTAASQHHVQDETAITSAQIKTLKNLADHTRDIVQVDQLLLTDQRCSGNWLHALSGPDEAARIIEIDSLDLLNTSDPNLGRLTRLAARVFTVPMAHIGLPSGDKNWIMAGLGMDNGLYDREASFCGHAIHEPDMLVVPDTLCDERFANHPMVAGPSNIRFYAGAVIRGQNLEPLASFCILDTEPRTFSVPSRSVWVVGRTGA
ncbi:GAF domain-containing protein [Roseovarius sp. D0-M9]|uniref:GAF domain-containing protein n=1 Tax=Roseovarius sp. D0-M9 TaxID=3127117 RepID=UPI00300FBDA5